MCSGPLLDENRFDARELQEPVGERFSPIRMKRRSDTLAWTKIWMSAYTSALVGMQLREIAAK